jgi:putative hydrolase of the HAD superfamily
MTGAGRVWFFDLDDTLHDASHGAFGAIDARMTDYVVRHLNVDRGEADRLRSTYWRRYGATMLGLIRHHAIDPHHFLRETHDFDLATLLRAERGLTGLFARLPGRKVLLTNAPADYAHRVLRGIGLHRQFPGQRSRLSIEDMRVHGVFRPKPSLAMLRAMLARERIGSGKARRAVLVDDNPANLKAARAAGFSTVLMTLRRGSGSRRLSGAHYIDARIMSLHRLPALARRMSRHISSR